MEFLVLSNAIPVYTEVVETSIYPTVQGGRSDFTLYVVKRTFWYSGFSCFCNIERKTDVKCRPIMYAQANFKSGTLLHLVTATALVVYSVTIFSTDFSVQGYIPSSPLESVSPWLNRREPKIFGLLREACKYSCDHN